MKWLKTVLALACTLGALSFCVTATAQFNSGSDGSDGTLNVTNDGFIIDMHDHPTGVYQYSSVNIPALTVFIVPNSNNTPLIWLIQSNCFIAGNLYVRGQSTSSVLGAAGGPGGGAGGSGGGNQSSGQGPGGGPVNVAGSYATQAPATYGTPAQVYGNSLLLPLLGGSGGGGASGVLGTAGGGGGGGAILIAASGTIEVNGQIFADGGGGGTGGSGGAIRLVAPIVTGAGNLLARGGGILSGLDGVGGSGRIRIDAFQNTFAGQVAGTFSQGFQPVIIPTPGQGVQLAIASIGGVPVSASPTGQYLTPDAIIPGQQSNPIAIVVKCANLPLNTQVVVTVKPATGTPVSASGYNSLGTLQTSTASVSLVMPRGAGIVFATAATGN